MAEVDFLRHSIFTSPMFNQLRQALLVFCGCGALLLGMSSMKATAANAKLYEMLGPEFRLSNDEAQNLHEKAEALYYQGDYQPAFACIEESLKKAEAAPNREDRDVAILLTTLAEGYLILGNPVQASNLLTRAVAVGERILGTNTQLSREAWVIWLRRSSSWVIAQTLRALSIAL